MSLQVWLPFNGSTENQGLMDIKTITAGSPTYTDGKMGKAVKSFGYTLKAESAKQILNNKELTIAFWVYVDLDEGSTDNRAMFFGVNSMTSLGGRQFSLFNYPTSNDFHWSWQNCVNGEYTMVSGGVLSGVIPTRTWTHIAVTYNNPNGKIYINGVEKKSFSGQYKTDSFEFDTPVIQQSDYYRYNDYRIYDHCLSPKEVKELSKGLCLHYKLNGNGNSNPNLAKGTNTSSISTNAMALSEKTGGSTRSIVYDNDMPCLKIVRNTTEHSGWSYLHYDNWQRDIIKTSTVYTVSFYIKATVDGTISLTGLLNGNATNYMTSSTKIISNKVKANEWSYICFQCTTLSSFDGITLG